MPTADTRRYIHTCLGQVLRTDHNPIIDIGGDKNRMNKMTRYHGESGGFPEIKVGRWEIRVGQMTKE